MTKYFLLTSIRMLGLNLCFAILLFSSVVLCIQPPVSECAQLASLHIHYGRALPDGFVKYTNENCRSTIDSFESCMTKFRDSSMCATLLTSSKQGKSQSYENFEAVFSGRDQVEPSVFLKYLFDQVNLPDASSRPSITSWIDVSAVPYISWLVMFLESIATFASFKSFNYGAYFVIIFSMLLQFLNSGQSLSYLVLVNLPAFMIYSKMLSADRDAKAFLATHMMLVASRVVLAALSDVQALVLFFVFMFFAIGALFHLFTLGTKATRVILFLDLFISFFTSFFLVKEALIRSQASDVTIKLFLGLNDLFTPRSSFSLINSFSFSHHVGGVLITFFGMTNERAVGTYLLLAVFYYFIIITIASLVGYLFSKQSKSILGDRLWLGLCNFFAYPENVIRMIADMFVYITSFNIYGFAVCCVYIGTSLYVLAGNLDIYFLLFCILRLGSEASNTFDVTAVGVHLMDHLSLPYVEVNGVDSNHAMFFSSDQMTRYSETTSRDLYDDDKGEDAVIGKETLSKTFDPNKRIPLYLVSNDQRLDMLGEKQPITIAPEHKTDPPLELQTFTSKRFVVVGTPSSTGSGFWLGRDKLITIAHVLADVISGSACSLNQAIFNVVNMKKVTSSKIIVDSVYIVDVERDKGAPKDTKEKMKEKDTVPSVVKEALQQTPISEVALTPIANDFSHIFVSGPDGIIPISSISNYGNYITFFSKKVKPGYSGSGVFGVRNGKAGLIACISCSFKDGSIGAVVVKPENG